MPRSVIALFSQSFPRPLPHSWRLVWQTNLVRWMNWLLALFLFTLPWFAVPHLFDSVELPKALLSLGALSVWFALRGAYSLLGNLRLEGGEPLPRRWSAFSLWIGLAGLATSLSWVLSPHRAISFLGNGWQIGSSLMIVFVGLWLIVALREAIQREPWTARFFLRAWFVGMCVALVGSLLTRSVTPVEAAPNLFSVAQVLDLWLFVPVVFMTGLALLATRATVEAPLTLKRLATYRLSHAILALTLAGLLVGALLIQLNGLWFVLLVGSSVAWALLLLRKRGTSLAAFIALLGILCSGFGLAQTYAGVATPGAIVQGRQQFGIGRLAEVLPNQSLSWRVAGDALKHAPLFGAGAGGWSSAFERVRPLELNQTPLWNVPFPRSASLLATLFTEYGLIPTVIITLFCLVLLLAALRQVKRTQDPMFGWYVLLVLVGLSFVMLRPGSVTIVAGLAVLLGLLSAQVFGPPKTEVTWSDQRVVGHSAVGVCLLVTLLSSIFVLQRAAAAELLTTTKAYAVPLARQLNAADDLTFAQEAVISIEEAQLASQQGDIRRAQFWLNRADQAVTEARKRDPADPGHVSLALRVAQLRAQSDEKSEDTVLQLAKTLDELRPTDPSSPLAIFEVARLRGLREARWVEQGQGRDKEEALAREKVANTLAEQALQESLRRKPDYFPALYAQAAWLAQIGNTKNAIAALEQLSQARSDSPDILLPLALLYRRNQEPDKAAAVLLKLIEKNPTNLDYQWQLSLALVQAERWNDATTVLQRLVATAPREEQYQTQLKEVLRRRAQTLTPVVPLETISAASSTAVTTTAPLRKTTAPRKRVTTPSR